MTKRPTRLHREIAEMADAQHRLGIMDEATRQEIAEKLRTDVADGSGGETFVDQADQRVEC
jgi:hypothetical protein